MGAKPGNPWRNMSKLVLVALTAMIISIAVIIAAPYLQHTQNVQETGLGSKRGSIGSMGLLRGFSSYDEIWAILENPGELHVAPTYYSYLEMLREAGRAVGTPAPLQLPAQPLGSGGTAAESPAVFSTTNVQVRGVDELDLVKTDGRIIVVASGGKTYIVDPSDLGVLSVISVNGTIDGVFLWGGRLALIVHDNPEPIYVAVRLPLIAPPIVVSGNTSVYIYDISNPSKPSEVTRITYSGHLFGARMINGAVYLVTSMPAIANLSPRVDGEPISPGSVFLVDPSPTMFTIVASIDLSSGAHKEFSLLMSQNSWIYMSSGRLYIVSILSAYNEALEKALEILADYMPSNISSQIRSLVDAGALNKALALVNEYLSSLSQSDVRSIVSNASHRLSGLIFHDVSRIHVIDVRGLEMSYSGYIDVPGRILDQFSIEEYKDHLIIATTSSNMTARISIATYFKLRIGIPGSISINITECRALKCVERAIEIPAYREPEPFNITEIVGIYIETNQVGETFNNVYIASVADKKITGSLTGLAEGERIYAARLVGNIFYLVTFRQVDPLYAIDINNPEEPEILGYIKIPGFSEYLHPISSEILLGIGVENNDLKISLFSVKDPRNIVETASLKIKNARSQALSDHHAVTIDIERGLLLIPITPMEYGVPAGIAVISIENNSLVLKAVLSHEWASRSIYIGDKVYTISHEMIRAFNIGDLKQVGEAKLA